MRVYCRNITSGSWVTGSVYVEDIKKADLIILPGGSDINPKIYGENVGRHTTFNRQLDLQDIEAVKYAVKNNIPIIGICRGAQLICALSGGSLIQHVIGHHGRHIIYTSNNRIYEVNSVHHQMMYLDNLAKDQYELLAWSKGISKTYLDGDNKEKFFKTKDNSFISLKETLSFKEPEVVYFKKLNALAIQCHPEWLNKNENKAVLEYFNSLVFEKLFNLIDSKNETKTHNVGI
jgi:gamma-glutamyl-gamma-aminobutyrate hydrolase PuuD